MRDHLYYVNRLGMHPHPEGGWYKETYRSSGVISGESLQDFSGDRNFSTAIYFLLTKENFSAFHRIKSDELWHFYDGDGLVIHELKPDGAYIEHKLGLNLDEGEQPQLVIAAGSWFSSEVKGAGEWSLVGCTVSPGFDFEDFEMASKDELLDSYPGHVDLVKRLCRS